MASRPTPKGALAANSPFALLMTVINQLHSPQVANNPAAGHDLARLATNNDILQGLQEQLQVRPRPALAHAAA